LAYELRNPLAPIRAAVRILREAGGPDPLLQRNRSVIERQGANMVRLLDDLLDVARVTRGKLRLQKGPLDLSTVTRDALETAAPLIEERRHTLGVRFAVEPLPLVGDRLRLEQVVINLLNNAAK